LAHDSLNPRRMPLVGRAKGTLVVPLHRLFHHGQRESRRTKRPQPLRRARPSGARSVSRIRRCGGRSKEVGARTGPSPRSGRRRPAARRASRASQLAACDPRQGFRPASLASQAVCALARGAGKEPRKQVPIGEIIDYRLGADDPHFSFRTLPRAQRHSAGAPKRFPELPTFCTYSPKPDSKIYERNCC